MSMTDPNRLLDEIRIASPCTASWEKMAGTETVRFCGECRLNVYNISNMKAAEAATLIDGAEGRLCVRLYKRKDGTVITKDCPVGVRAAMRRAARAAGAALTAVLGLFSGVLAMEGARAAGEQDEKREPVVMGGIAPPSEPPVVQGQIVASERDVLVVKVLDSLGRPIAGATLTAHDLGTGAIYSIEADEDGICELVGLEPGVYSYAVSADGHLPSEPKTVRLRANRPVRVEVALEGPEMLMGEIDLPQRSK